MPSGTDVLSCSGDMKHHFKLVDSKVTRISLFSRNSTDGVEHSTNSASGDLGMNDAQDALCLAEMLPAGLGSSGSRSGPHSPLDFDSHPFPALRHFIRTGR